MQSDAPQAEAGLTRRARRSVEAASSATSATADGLSRSELRRAAIGAGVAPAVVWGTPRSDASAVAVVELVPAVEPAPAELIPAADAAPASVTREPPPTVSSRRLARSVSPAVKTIETEATPAAPAASVADVEADVNAPVAASAEDDFEAAARVFCFTAETPVQRAAAAFARDDAESERAESADAEADDSATGSLETASRPPRKGRAKANTKTTSCPSARPAKSGGRRFAAASFTVGVMGAVGMLTVAMAAPAEAVAAASSMVPVTSIQAPGTSETTVDKDDIQAFVAPADVDNSLHRDETYQTTTFSEIAAATGITRHTNFFVNNPTGAIQWPFAVGVPLSYGYGARWGSVHNGLDFTPGEGASIQAIADGTVRIATESGAAYGVYVVVDHVINGQLVSSMYAHMLHGSLQVEVGQQIKVGTVLGHTGDTGLSYGAHTHFELTVNGTRIDPLPWLRENAGG